MKWERANHGMHEIHGSFEFSIKCSINRADEQESCPHLGSVFAVDSVDPISKAVVVVFNRREACPV